MPQVEVTQLRRMGVGKVLVNDPRDHDALRQAAHLARELPHGSGINCDWVIRQTVDGDGWLCSNSYHGMLDNGIYCCWVDFTVKAFVGEDGRWDLAYLQFNGAASHRNARHAHNAGTRDYLEDIIWQDLQRFWHP